MGMFDFLKKNVFCTVLRTFSVPGALPGGCFRRQNGRRFLRRLPFREPPLKCRFSREFFSFGRKNGPKYSQSALFMIFLVSLLSFLCYNNLTICF